MIGLAEKRLVIVAAVLLAGCGGGGGGGGGDNDGGGGPGIVVSGGIVAAQGSVADRDVNDPNAPYATNDFIDTPQEIPNPTRVGGYVNVPDSGEEGRSFEVGDTSDIFLARLAAGQQIHLTISDPLAGDLDLWLWDPDGNPLDSSETGEPVETVVAPADGAFLVEVYAYDGASSYVLTIGQETAPLAASRVSSLADFVPGEVIARFSDAVSPTGARTAARTAAAAAGLSMKAQVADPAAEAADASAREVLLTLDGPPRPKSLAAIDENRHATAGSSPARRQLPDRVSGVDPAKRATIDAIKRLGRSPGVVYAEPNYRFRTSLAPNDQYYPLQWHYPLIGLPAAWDITTGSSDVVVAVIDSGIILTHPDMQGSLRQGYDFVSDPESALDGDGIDSDPGEPVDPIAAGSTLFHGTHVAGTIGAASNNAAGVAGINWSVSIMPLRAIGALGSGTAYDIAQALRYAARLANDSGTLPASAADVINLSLGGGTYSQTLQDLIIQARANGVIVVAAAGNENTSAPSYPAAYNGVVSVSAVGIDRGKTPYSNYGPTIDVAAPGGGLASDINGDGYPDGILSPAGEEASGVVRPVYSFLQGTSMATPHVAGVVALMRAVNPTLTPAAFDALLADGLLTRDLGAPGRDDLYGYGLIDAHAAVVAAGGLPGTARVLATPAAMNFGSLGSSLFLIVENSGGSMVSVDTPQDDAPWLTVAPSATGADGLGRYSATVSRSGLAAGTYTATITITSSANTVTVPVIMQVSSAVLAGDAGHQYVLMVDAESGESVYQDTSDAVDGRYSFRFTDIEPGEYLVISGSDSDNDGFICDAGESCGAHLTLEQPSVVDPAGDVTLPDFTVSYVSGLAAQAGPPAANSGRGWRRLVDEASLRRVAP